MAAIPPIPAFEAGDWHLWRLQQLSAAVSFAVRCPVVFHLYKTATQAIAGSPVSLAVSWDAVMADSDGGWAAGNPTRYTAQTPGYFSCDFGVNMNTTVTDNAFAGYLQVTTGPNNPGGAGNTTVFANRRDDTGTSATQISLSAGGMSPYLYLGDYIEVFVFSTQNGTISNNWNTSGNNDLNGFPDGGVYFTGALASLGP